MIELMWVCEQKFLQEYLEMRAYVGTERAAEIGGNDAIKVLLSEGGADDEDIFRVDGEVAHISIKGVLSPKGPDWIDKFFGVEGTSYAKIIAAANRALEDDNVKETHLHVSSPGGTVSGVEEAHRALVELASKKRVVAINEDVMASGAYWLAVAAHEIVSTNPVNETGSIGVVTSQWDFTDALSREGIRKVVLTSSNAPFKASDLTTDQGKAVIKERLDAIERVFHARIAEGRRTSVDNVKENFGRGRVLIALDPNPDYPDAISVGMIDKVQGYGFERTKNTEEKMTLKEALAQYPELVAEIERLKAECLAEGEAKAKARVDQASKFLASEYPEDIRNIAVKVVEGSEKLDVLKGAVSYYDAVKAREGQSAAQDEAQAALKTTPVNQPAPTDSKALSTDGAIRTEADIEKESARLRNIR